MNPLFSSFFFSPRRPRSRGPMRSVTLPPWRGWCAYTTTWGDAVWSSPWRIWMLCPPSTRPTGWDCLRSGSIARHHKKMQSPDIGFSSAFISSEHTGKRDPRNDERRRCSHPAVTIASTSRCSHYGISSPDQWGTGLPLCRTGTTGETHTQSVTDDVEKTMAFQICDGCRLKINVLSLWHKDLRFKVMFDICAYRATVQTRWKSSAGLHESKV